MDANARLYDLTCRDSAGTHKLVWREWGDPKSERILICVHGLTRNGLDFAPLAEEMARAGFRVIAPDMPGRGKSARLDNPLDYGLHQYVSDCHALIAELGLTKMDWLGTSMGGLIGMIVASQPGNPISRLILNDVGPFLPAGALKRIGDYVGQQVYFRLWQDAYDYMTKTYAPFGVTSSDHWWYLTEISFEEKEPGLIGRNYDPAIAEPFKSLGHEDLDLWMVYDQITAPTMVIRGAQSDLLLEDTCWEMAKRGPQANIIELAGIGHAPALLDRHQIDLVKRWLEK